MPHDDAGYEDKKHERTPRLLRVLVFFNKYPELLTILVVVILALIALIILG